ncbi:MAG: HDOD domain-containing protein [Deltaproteobacteria bacterium]|nr:HDOD domain-containing protein [Deltaproteobacteria bacterium]
MPDIHTDNKQLNVLLADDDSNITLALKLIIGSNFHCEGIETAADGMEAWGKVQAGGFDLVVSDWNMPNMDGSLLLKKIRENERTKRLPFLMMTVRTDIASVSAAVKAGVTDYVIKPFDKQSLIKKIGKLVSARPSHDIENEAPVHAAEETVDPKSISVRIMELIGKGEVTLPAMPQVIFEIEETMKREDANVTDLAKLIAMDVGISSRLMGVANSVFYGGAECTAVDEAILRLGMHETKQLVYLIANRNLFALKDRRYEKIIEDLYIHSIACGAAGQAMAKNLRLNDSYNYFAIGLLHDIGKLLVLQVLSEITKNTRGVDITLALNIMDSLHNKAGYMLLEKWNFPKIYSLIALNHENISDFDRPEEELSVIYLANRFVRKAGYSLAPDDNGDILSEKPAKLLKLNAEVLEKVSGTVKEQVDRIKSVL